MCGGNMSANARLTETKARIDSVLVFQGKGRDGEDVYKVVSVDVLIACLLVEEK